MPGTKADRRIRALRGAKNNPDPRAVPATLLEYERTESGGLETALTVFLIGSECPFTCVFCDLWQETVDGPTPPGALPAQLASALETWAPCSPRGAASSCTTPPTSSTCAPCPRNEARLLVAASPNDRVADSHWLREDVDAFFVEKAVEEGVRYLDRTRISDVRVDADGVRLTDGGCHAAMDEDRLMYTSWLCAVVAPRDVAGLLDPARQNLYPVNLDVLVERASLLGLTPEQVRERLPLLRGGL